MYGSSARDSRSAVGARRACSIAKDAFDSLAALQVTGCDCFSPWRSRNMQRKSPAAGSTTEDSIAAEDADRGGSTERGMGSFTQHKRTQK